MKPGLATQLAQIEELLEAGRLAEAIDLTRQAAQSYPDRPELKGLLTRALVAQANARGFATGPEGMGANRGTAAMYLEAGTLDPGVRDVYIGMARLVFDGQIPARPVPWPSNWYGEIVPGIAALWSSGVQRNPALAQDSQARVAAAIVAAAAEQPALAADICPEWLDLQIVAAEDLCGRGDRERGVEYWKRARSLGGDRADVLALAAALGQWSETAVEQVLNVSLGPVRSLGYIAVHEGTVYCSIEGQQGATILRVEPGGAVPATLVSGCATSFDVSPDGRSLACASSTGQDTPCDIRVLDLGSGQAKTIDCTAGYMRGLAWSPQGDRLAYSSMKDGLVVVNSDGSGRRQLFWQEDTQPATPQWSPDGRRLLFGEVLYEGCGPACVVDVDSGKWAAVTDGGCYRPVWDANARRITGTFGDYGDLYDSRPYLIDPAAKEPLLLADGVIDGYALAWSPDGRRVLLGVTLIRTWGSRPPEEVGVTRLWMYDTQTARWSLLPQLQDGSSPWIPEAVWAPDGTIYFFAWTPGAMGADRRLVGWKVK